MEIGEIIERVVEFQSHFGLILTELVEVELEDLFLFQSHFGLILTRKGYNESKSDTHFNPILV